MRPRLKLQLAIGTFLLLTPTQAFCQGGPPLVTDDPDTPGDKHWEINLAGLASVSKQNDSFNFPYIDANYGVGERIQLKFETGLETLSQAGCPLLVGGSTSLAGIKWRFFDQGKDGISVSIYPQFEFHLFPDTVNGRTLSGPGNNWLFPIEVAKHLGPFETDIELGYEIERAQNEWFYGAVIAYPFVEGRELLFEIHGTTLSESGDTEIFFNIGTHLDLNEHFAFIGSLGHTLRVYSGSDPETFLYCGVQLRI